MASNIDVTQGSGKTVATEEIGGEQYQKIKITDGRTGSTVGMRVNPDGSINASIIGTVNIAGSVVAVVTSNPNQSVSGAVNVSGSVLLGSSNASVIALIQGSVATVSTGNQSVSGALNVSGSVLLGSSNASVIAVITGSIAAVPAGNQSISGAINVSGSVMLGSSNASVIAVLQSSSIIAVVTGSVVAQQAGTVITSLVSTVPSSVIVGTSIFGQLPGGTAMLGSVATLQGTNPWLIRFGNSSIIAINAGSVVAISQGSVIAVLQGASIVGTYSEDATHATVDKGVFILGVRNDAVASFTSANLDYGPQGTDSAGRMLTKPFAAEEARVEGYNSVVSTSVTTLVAAAGTGLKNYITDVVVANTGATTTLITFRSGGGTSVLGYAIAPTGGGSNMIGWAMPMRTLANETFDFQATSSSSILYVKVSGFKAP